MGDPNEYEKSFAPQPGSADFNCHSKDVSCRGRDCADAEHVSCPTCGQLKPVDAVCPVCHPPHAKDYVFGHEAKADFHLMTVPVYTDEAKEIMDIARETLVLFAEKNRGYKHVVPLGNKAFFIDIWRKVGKLKATLWDGESTGAFESNEEMLMDLVGHCLMGIRELRKSQK